jgi:mannose-6-phosphate isomerase-like protein (cupin superfamily)
MTYADFALNLQTDGRTNWIVPQVAASICDHAGLAALRAIWAGMDAIPKVVGKRSEGEDVSFLGLDIRTLLRGEESAGRHSFHSIILKPGASIPAHWIEGGQTIWYVMHGEVTFRIGTREESIAAAGFAYAPPETTQALANRGNGPAEVYVWHSPAGAERAFAAARDLCAADASAGEEEVFALMAPYGFHLSDGSLRPVDCTTNKQERRIELPVARFEDFAAMRAEWSKQAPVPRLVAEPQACRNIQVGGQESRVLLSPEASASHASSFLLNLRGGFGAPLHHQCSEDECFIVLDGPLKLTVGNITLEGVGYGAFAYVPRYATHGFQSAKDRPAQMFSMNSPGGHDRGFELGSTVSEETPGFSDMIEAHGFTFHEHA